MSDASQSRAAARAQAAHWLNLRCSGDMMPEDERRFAAWLDQSPDHREAYRIVDRAWAISGAMVDEPALAAAPERVEAEPKAPAPWRRHAMALAASLLIMIGIGWTSAPFWAGGTGAPEWRDQTFRTGTGQRARMTLTDGSIVTLDAETELRLQDGAEERRLDLLRGRAYFEVAHDPKRPFIVHAGDKQVRAIGTAFEVSFERGRMSVILVEGKVRVQGDKGATETVTEMVPGRQLSVGSDTNWAIKPVDVEKETSWTEGRLIFMNDPLAKAVAEVNRYSTRKLMFEEDRIPPTQIVGVFEAGDVEGFVKALELNGIAYRGTATGDKILLVAKEK